MLFHQHRKDLKKNTTWFKKKYIQLLYGFIKWDTYVIYPFISINILNVFYISFYPIFLRRCFIPIFLRPCIYLDSRFTFFPFDWHQFKSVQEIKNHQHFYLSHNWDYFGLSCSIIRCFFYRCTGNGEKIILKH